MILDIIVPSPITDIRDFPEWSVRYLQQCKQLQQAWIEAISDDNKISSSEAEKLCAELNDMIAGLGLFITYFTGSENNELGDGFSILKNQNSIKVDIKKLPQKVEVRDFPKWYDKFIRVKLRKLLNSGLAALSDEKITESESADLKAQATILVKELLHVSVWLKGFISVRQPD